MTGDGAMIDSWNPATFSNKISSVLSEYSELVRSYYEEDRRLMDEHLNSSPYQSLKPNKYHGAYANFKEEVLTPIISNSRVRVWHYTRLTNKEVESMQQKPVLSSLIHLKERLSKLVAEKQLTPDEAKTVYSNSPFHMQHKARANRLWSTNIPLSHNDSGVIPLLGSWGGESAYFWLKDKSISEKLKKIGAPRIIELETDLSDDLNGYKVSETIIKAWAKMLGISLQVSGCDLAITGSINTTKTIKVHTEGEPTYETIASTYPIGAASLLGE